MFSRYDELSLSYRRCLKDLAKKDKQLKLVNNENETLRTKLDDLQKKYRELHGKMEIVCCKYLYLHNRKDEEIIRLRKCLNYASFMVRKITEFFARFFFSCHCNYLAI